MKKLLAFIVAAILCLSCFAACGKKNEAPQNNESTPTQVVYDVEDATAYLKNMYKKYLVETETAADFTLVSQVMKGGVVYKVTWTTDREDIKIIVDEENKQVKIDLNEKTKVDITYKLTATITDPDGKTATLTFELKVPKYVLSTWEEYMAMEDGKAVVVEGYIAAVHAPSEGNKYNTLYLHDVNNKGGYYVYSMADDKDLVKDLGLKKGMLVSVTGTKTIYNGTHEIKDASVNVLDTTVVDFKPLDITATYKAATSLKDKALTDKLGMLVTIKGVEITDQDLSEKSQYLNFKLAGLTTYLRVYATDCPVSVTDAGQKSIIEEHGKKKGYEADVTGVVVMYSGAIYLNPVSDTPFAYGKKIERTPEQMVEVEMDEVKFDKDITLDKTLTLPTKGNTYEDVKITWASNSEAIVIDGDKAKIKLQDEATTASITATFTLGTISKTKTFEFNLSKKSGIVPQNAANPVPGVAYKFFYTQTQLGEYRYFDGTAGKYYLNTTNDINAAVDVYLEAAATAGYYYLYFMDGDTKNYLEAYVSDTGYCNSKVSADKPAVAFKLDSALENAPIVNLTKNAQTGPLDYFLGTYDANTDMRPSEYKYAAQGNYVAHLGTVVDVNSISSEEKVATEKEGLKLEANEFFVDAEIDLTTAGSIYDDVTITWASNSEYAVVDGGKLKVTMPTASATATLTATLTCGTVTDTKTFDISFTVVSTEAYAPVVAGIRPEEGKAYKYAVYQTNLGKWLYADGTFGERYLNTTENYDEGVDYYAELVSTDVYKFYILEGTTKKYLTIYKNASDKDSVKFDAAGTNTFTYDAVTGAWATDFNNTTYYVGTFNSYDTLSASKTSYIDATNTGVSQFPANPVSLAITETALKADTAYKFAMTIPGKMLYIDGGLDSSKNRYFTTTANPSEGIDVYLEEANDGYKFYTLDGTTKKYLVAYLNGENKTSLKYDAAESTVFIFNSTTNIWMTNLDGTDYYMGTYTNNGTTYETVSLSKTSFINETNTGVSQFPLNLVAVKFSDSATGGEGGNEGGNEGQMTITSIVDAIAIGAAKGHNEYTTENHYVAGVITEIVSTKYGNTYITDEFGNTIYTYGLYDSTGATRYDSMTVKPQVGDYIVVSAPIGKFNDVIQLKNPKLVEHIAATSITEANTIGAAQPDKGAATTDKYLVTGEITTAPDSKYGNCTIKDTEGNTLTVYGMYNSTGETRYDALTTKPQAGDTVTLYGVLSNYNGPQIKNAWLYGYVAGTPSGGNEGGEGGSTPAPTGTAYYLTTTKDNVTYYYNGQVGGANYTGGTTTNIAEAVKIYTEANGSNVSLYFMSGSTKKYLKINDENKGFANPGSTAGAFTTATVAGKTVYVSTGNGDARAFCLYHNTYNTDVYEIRTYKTSSSSATDPFALVVAE